MYVFYVKWNNFIRNSFKQESNESGQRMENLFLSLIFLAYLKLILIPYSYAGV